MNHQSLGQPGAALFAAEAVPAGALAATGASYAFYKRAFDIAASALALALLSPVMLAVAAAIRLEDGGPVLYASKRVGGGLREVVLYKFRSMVVGADARLDEVRALNELGEGPRFKLQADPRITRVGRVIRRCSLDELPQLWNVLRGDISLVGPRPHSVYEVQQYDGYALRRFTVRSGLTCYSECLGRSRLSFQDSIELDMKYLRERGLWTDCKILLLTAVAVFKKDGAA